MSAVEGLGNVASSRQSGKRPRAATRRSAPGRRLRGGMVETIFPSVGGRCRETIRRSTVVCHRREGLPRGRRVDGRTATIRRAVGSVAVQGPEGAGRYLPQPPGRSPACRYLLSVGILATIRSEVVNSSNCSHGRNQATALYEPGAPGISLTSILAAAQRVAGPWSLGSGLSSARDVVRDPAVQPRSRNRARLHERADLVAGDHLQVVGEARGGHDVRQPGRDGRVGRRRPGDRTSSASASSARRRTPSSRCSCSGTAAGIRACSIPPRGGR